MKSDIAYKNYKKGFTLFELIVVIAIIGILSVVVITSISAAKIKARDNATKTAMNAAKAAGEIYFGMNTQNHSPYNYNGVCAYLSTTPNTFPDAQTQAGSVVSCNDTVSGGTAFTAYIQIPSGPYYCIDSTGISDEIGSTIPANGVANFLSGSHCK